MICDMSRNVLITGCAGFLGSHLAAHYLSAGDKVWGVDNFCTSDERSEHLTALKAHHPNFKFMMADICDDHGEWAPKDVKLDLILNFACPASPPAYQDMPVLTMLTCTQGTANVLDVADQHHAVVVHASTSEVYGEPLVTPQAEGLRSHVNSYGPRACYDAGKMAAEALAYDYLNMYTIDARIVRIFNTYGPHMQPDDGRVVSNFIRQALQGEALTVYGDGQQGRSFCYVDDLIRGIVAVGELQDNPCGPINLGNPCEYRVIELAEKVCEKINGGLPPIKPHSAALEAMIIHRPMPIDDPTQRCPDITRAKTLLGWEPRVGLDEGLDRTIAYFKHIVK